MFSVRVRCLCFAILSALVAGSPVRAQTAPGIVDGRVLDAQTSEPLVAARVTVAGTALLGVTDRDGRFRLLGVPSGARTLVVSFLGRRDQAIEIQVPSGAILACSISFDQPLTHNETVNVSSDLILGAQARALNQQKTAPNISNVASADQIGSFPDPNAAETTQRIPGLSIQRDQGEGRYVIVRGMEPRLNSMMIDGERIPAPDPLIRQVALDVVPSDLLQSIEVSKSLTPDVDADAIGGSVNLVMKRAPERLRVFGSAGSGYNELADSYSQNNYSLTGGGRFAEHRIGMMLSLAGSGTTRANQDVEVSYANGALADLDPRYYEVNRRRIGGTGALDFKAAGGLYTVRGVFNRFIDDHEKRNRLRERVANRRIERERRDRTHIERISSLSFEGRRLAGRNELDFRLQGAYSDQFDPLTMTTTFRQSGVNFAPNVSADSIDPDNIQANPLNESLSASTFNSQIRATNFAKDRDLVGSANLRVALRQDPGSATFLKFGFKVRDKQKGRDRNESTYTTTSSLLLTNFVLADADPRSFLDGRYTLLPFIDQDLAARIPDLVPVTVTRNHTRDAEEFDGTERTGAAYVMGEIYVGSKLFILPGLRYEYTSADFTGRDVRFAPSGAWLDTQPLGSTKSYGLALPSVQARYAITPDTNVRAALTRSLARPNYYDTVPYRAQNDLDGTIALGNADLRPTAAWNADVLAEHYFRTVGVVSAGLFYKRLNDYIYGYTFDQAVDGSIYHVSQPLNGDTATLRGAEVALQNQLTFLPAVLQGIGIYANYTFTDSSARFPNHAGASTLPGQSRHVGNLAASYERAGFSGRVAMNFHGAYVDQVGATTLLDRFYDTHRQLDVSVTQKVSRNLRVYANGLNLNDALLRYYQGVPNRPLQEEHYHWWADFGLRVNF